MDEFNNKPLVSIQCLVYNHEPFLRQCLDGFVMQKTTFPFEAIIHDDVSSDSSAAIIREYADKYPDIIKPVFESENQYSINGFCKLMNIMNDASRGKYIAFCEGDDYWIDPFKLQKQVDYMEAHPECGLVHTKHKCLNNETGEFIEGWAEETNFDKNLIRNRICTLTACFRRDLYVRYLSESFPREQWPMGDAPLWLYIMAHSSSKLLCDETGVYRILTESASHSNNINKNIEFLLGGYEMKLFFIKKYEKYEFQKNNAQYVVKELKRLSYLYNKNIDFNFLAFLTKNDIFDLKLYLSTFATHSSFLRFVINKLKH